MFRSLSKLLVGLSFLASASSFAAPISVSYTNIESYGGLGDPDNFVSFVDVGANSRITSVDYSLSITALDPSWLADLVVAFERSDFLSGVFFTPGFAEIGPGGTQEYAGFADLVELGLDFQVGADGLLRLEFFDTVDDLPGVEGIWNYVNFTFGVETVDEPAPVPEPASALLLAAGLAAMRQMKRRRSAHDSAAPAIG